VTEGVANSPKQAIIGSWNSNKRKTKNVKNVKNGKDDADGQRSKVGEIIKGDLETLGILGYLSLAAKHGEEPCQKPRIRPISSAIMPVNQRHLDRYCP
jgi:hypothetical protein